MSSEEEDYLSDAFLLGLDNGNSVTLTKTRAEKRKIEIEKRQKERKQKQQERNKLILKKKENDKRRLENALNSALDENNKGFAMLAKMGYKAGESIGKKGEGITEPIKPEILKARQGLGRNAFEIKKIDEKIELEQIELEKKKNNMKELQANYRVHLQEQKQHRSTKKYLAQSRSACETLDKQKGLFESDFWYKPEVQIKDMLAENPAAKVAEEEDIVELSEEEKIQKDKDDLILITKYLRENYFYCCWCGFSYEDDMQLRDVCPGNTAEVHDLD